MANNRLYIRCKQCGGTICIGKEYGNGLHHGEYRELPFIDRLNEFYQEHYYCAGNHEFFEPVAYALELCEEIPGMYTDSHYDDYNRYHPFRKG